MGTGMGTISTRQQKANEIEGFAAYFGGSSLRLVGVMGMRNTYPATVVAAWRRPVRSCAGPSSIGP